MSTTTRAIICADCGETFDSDAPYVKYCPGCRLKRYRPKNPVEIKVCACGCGMEFETTRPWAKFYDSQHRNAYHRQKMEEALKSG